MNLGVVVAEEVGVDLAEDVEVHADMSKTWTTLREILEAMMDSLEVTTGVLRMVNQENHLKDMVGAGLVLLSEEVAKVVSAMEKLLKENVLGGFLTVTVVLEEGQYSSGELLLASMKAHSFHFFFIDTSEYHILIVSLLDLGMSSNVKDLVVETGVLLLMKLHSEK